MENQKVWWILIFDELAQYNQCDDTILHFLQLRYEYAKCVWFELFSILADSLFEGMWTNIGINGAH